MSTLLAAVAAGSAGVAVQLALRPSRPGLGSPGASTGLPAQSVAPDIALLTRLRIPLAALAFVGGWAFLGGVVGAAGGVVAAVVAWRVVSGSEGPAARRRRELLVAELPTAVDLVGACLRGGASVETALRTVAVALPGPVGDELAALHHRLLLGADPASVWSELTHHPQLGPLGRAVARAHETGASVTSAVARLAEELRARGRAEVEQRARSVDVKAAAPLGICFLPAFLLLGVVPMVAGVFGSMRFLG